MILKFCWCKLGGVFCLSIFWKVGLEEKDWSMVSLGIILMRKRFIGVEFIVYFLE